MKDETILSLEKKPPVWVYLCTQVTCRHFLDPFEVVAWKKPTGYYKCPACGCSGEYAGIW